METATVTLERELWP